LASAAGPEASLEVGDTPSVTQASQQLDRLHWLKAIESEYNSLLLHNTWHGINPPKGRRPIGVKWVLKIKRLPDVRLDKYKARLVVKGCSQVQGLDYDILFAPVAKRTSLLYFLYFVASEVLECHAVDNITAFLNGALDKDIYISNRSSTMMALARS
jgi:hypothetical protein